MIKVTHNESFFGLPPSTYGMEGEVNYIYDLEINNLTTTDWQEPDNDQDPFQIIFLYQWDII